MLVKKGSGMLHRLAILGVFLALVVPSSAWPISFYKEKRSVGPEPPNLLSLQVGILTGATAEGLIDAISQRTLQIAPGTREDFDDFEDGLWAAMAYQRRIQPQVAVLLDLNYTRLRTTSLTEGVNISSMRYISDKEIAVDLFAVSGAVLYYFQKPEDSLFRVYTGAGFGLYVPSQKYSDERTFLGGSPPVTDTDRQTQMTLGVNGLFGLAYRFANLYSFFVQAKGQIIQGDFHQPVPDNDGNLIEGTNVLDYSGVVLSLGVARHF
jgi:hypothetical protein